MLIVISCFKEPINFILYNIFRILSDENNKYYFTIRNVSKTYY